MLFFHILAPTAGWQGGQRKTSGEPLPVTWQKILASGRETYIALSLGGGGIEGAPDLGDPVGREAAALGVGTDQLLAGRDVDAVQLVIGGIALQPLDLGAEPAQDLDGLSGHGLALLGRPTPDSGNVSLDDVLRHQGLRGCDRPVRRSRS